MRALIKAPRLLFSTQQTIVRSFSQDTASPLFLLQDFFVFNYYYAPYQPPCFHPPLNPAEGSSLAALDLSFCVIIDPLGRC